MKTSEAIRRGCEKVPFQNTGSYFGFRGNRVSCCVLGAAYVGFTGSTFTLGDAEFCNSGADEDITETLINEVPDENIYQCPVG